MTSSTIVSAPGSVSLVGWLGRLDYNLRTVAVPVDVRAYVKAETSANGQHPGTLRITVHHPQFSGTPQRFWVVMKDGRLDRIIDPEDCCPNNGLLFDGVSETLNAMLSVIGERRMVQHLSGDLDITVVADEKFYAINQPARHKELIVDGIDKKFATWNVELKKAKFTGLGSSGATASALSSAIFLHFNAIPVESVKGTAVVLPALRAQQWNGDTNGYEVITAFHGPVSFSARPFTSLTAEDSARVEFLSHTASNRFSATGQIGGIVCHDIPPLMDMLVATFTRESRSIQNNVIERIKQTYTTNPGILRQGAWLELNVHENCIALGIDALCRFHEEDTDAYSSVLDRVSRLGVANAGDVDLDATVHSRTLYAIRHVRSAAEEYVRTLTAIGTIAGATMAPPNVLHRLTQALSINGVIAAGICGGGPWALWVLVCQKGGGGTGPGSLITDLEAAWQPESPCAIFPCSTAASALRVERR